MHALVEFGGGTGEALLIAYLVVGVVTFLAAFMPGNSPLYRVVCLLLGAVMAAWAAQAMFFGGWVIVNALVLVAPVLLLIRGGVGWIVHAVRAPAAAYGPPGYLPAPRPHPATRPFGAASVFAPQPPYGQPAYANPALPTATYTTYATVHHAYPASPGAARHASPARPEPGVPMPLSARAPRQRAAAATAAPARHRA